MHEVVTEANFNTIVTFSYQLSDTNGDGLTQTFHLSMMRRVIYHRATSTGQHGCYQGILKGEVSLYH
jgi:hypothetical protein